MVDTPPCLHCGLPSRLTNGKEIYPHRQDLWSKPIYKCNACDATCGCHPGTLRPLGSPANKETRQVRMKLHKDLLDPLWKSAPKHLRGKRRSSIYKFLSERMGLSIGDTHTGMFTLEQCRDAWKHLKAYQPDHN